MQPSQKRHPTSRSRARSNIVRGSKRREYYFDRNVSNALPSLFVGRYQRNAEFLDGLVLSTRLGEKRPYEACSSFVRTTSTGQ
jgi:hypothetical protein